MTALENYLILFDMKPSLIRTAVRFQRIWEASVEIDVDKTSALAEHEALRLASCVLHPISLSRASRLSFDVNQPATPSATMASLLLFHLIDGGWGFI